MGFWRSLAVMTVEAVDRACIVSNDKLDRGADRDFVIDISGSIMAHPAIVCVDREDIFPVLNGVTVGAGLGVNLALVVWANRHRMLSRTACGAVVMTGKVGCVAGNTLALLAAA